jgi:hypothetical protein
MNQPEERKIIIDEDWKTSVQQEKERLKEGAETSGSEPAQGQQMPLPPASFPLLVTRIATEAMLAMGQFAETEGEEPERYPELARHHIDTLAVLQEKTKGNLTAEEFQLLESSLHQLRMAFVASSSAPS